MLAHEEWIIKPVWSVKLLGPMVRGKLQQFLALRKRRIKAALLKNPSHQEILTSSAMHINSQGHWPSAWLDSCVSMDSACHPFYNCRAPICFSRVISSPDCCMEIRSLHPPMQSLPMKTRGTVLAPVSCCK